MRPVYVVGVGLHPYRPPAGGPYLELGLTAVRAALADAGIQWPAVEAAYTGTALLGVAASRPLLRFLGATGIPMVQVENASASGSSAFRMACLDVASGASDVALALGVDQPAPRPLASDGDGLPSLTAGLLSPPAQFALLADEYQRRHGLEPADIARVAVKNHAAGAANPFAQRRQTPSLDEVLEASPIAGMLTKWQCCPVGEGAAAVLVASEEALERLGDGGGRAVEVLASAARSERVYAAGANPDEALTAETARAALEEAEVDADDLDVIELHDAFSVEELIYLEAIGVRGPGEAAAALAAGDFDIGGRTAVSPSGGLLSMGHPIGPTGIGQIAEITRQLRGEAGERQQPEARLGLAHMVGVGSVCLVHVLRSAG
jgi:acetyl-CoA acetyltransferase